VTGSQGDRVLTRGKTPRNFALGPGGHWLVAASQQSDALAVFKVDQTTGQLTAAGSPVRVGAQVCVLFDAAP
jgi:6-phosphogluconolactonase